MNRCHPPQIRVFGLAALLALVAGACALVPARPVAETKPEPKPTKVVCDPPRDRKPTSAPAPFLVEAFRCSMQPSPSLNVGIRVYSSLDGKETTLIYGPDRMDTPPVENDSFMYPGAKIVLAGTADGKTQYTFTHPKISLQIEVPRSASKTDVFDAVYSEETGANGVKGICTRVSTVTY